MPGLARAELAILDSEGQTRGRLILSALPSHRQERTLWVGEDDDDLEKVRLVEGKEYVFVFERHDACSQWSTDHPEMFVADTEVGDRGRLRTGLWTGLVDVQVFAASTWLGRVSFEVQSTKLSYLGDYHWMLRDIAEVCAELLQDRFAPAAARFSVDDVGHAKTLYQRFTFLQGLLEGDEFHAAMGQIFASPYVTWEEMEDESHRARGVRPGARAARSLTRPGPRSQTNQLLTGDLESIPQRMLVPRTTASVDNGPNRFVRWLLREWLALAAHVATTLERFDDTNAFVRRGRRSAARIATMLEALLTDDFFEGIGDLRVFPEASQVLQKREGYRYLLRAHWQFEAAARLVWPGMETLYLAGQRNVAKLYEYWVYLKIGQIVANLCGSSFDVVRLIEPSADGLTLRLRSGEETMVAGTVERFGRTIRVESWFNKSFGMVHRGAEGSWTRPLRPDCSLRLEVAMGNAQPLVTWIHFDAKYRVERLEEALDRDANDDDGEMARSRFRRDDLLKMHAYKDAIRQSAGAYIVYPGTDEDQPFRQYHELLPGLGAFALRPGNDGTSRGGNTLAVFIDHVLAHLGLQVTQYERARYWTELAFAGPRMETVSPATRFLEQPPADVSVLLGYAKTSTHRGWIRQTGLYNLRADEHRGGAVGVRSRELGAHLLVVFGPDQVAVDVYKIVDAPRISMAADLQAIGYPEPQGHYYFCLTVEPLTLDARTSLWLDARLVERVRVQKNPSIVYGAPMAVTWLDLCAGIGLGG